jgi:hyaluronoglucosaminidase
MIDLGIVEGYFGNRWSFAARASVMRLLAPHGYSFFIYAPKADALLRERWREPYSDAQLRELGNFAHACRANSVRFGVGLSPFEAYLDFDRTTRAELAAKLAQLDALGVDDLAILFDDMRGDLRDLAARQVEIAHFAVAHSKASSFVLCPTYYSDDPVLDRVFGARPTLYLEQLGTRLDPKINVFWTGEEVCAREHSIFHLRRVADQLRRKPFLWDNYPVNDGARMSKHLHLRAFTGRPVAIGAYLVAHAVNPALQPVLSCIPAITLAASYRAGTDYAYGAAFRDAAMQVAGEPLATMLAEDLLTLQDTGLDNLGERRATLRERYAAIDHPAAREVVGWLDGAYAVEVDKVETQ